MAVDQTSRRFVDLFLVTWGRKAEHTGARAKRHGYQLDVGCYQQV